MGLPPALGIEKAPDREMATLRLEFSKVSAGDVDREHAAALLFNAAHPEPMTLERHQWFYHPVAQEDPADGKIKEPPVPYEERVAGEVDPGRDLVAEGEHDGQVRVEVDEVPRLVGQLAPGDGDRDPDHGQEEAEGDDGGEHSFVAGDEVEQVGGDVLAIAELVAERLEEAVAEQQADREVAVPFVEDGHPLEAEGVLEGRQPGHQEKLPEHQVGADQTGDPAEAVEEVRSAPGDLEARADPPQADDQDGVGGEERAVGAWPRQGRATLRLAPGNRLQGRGQLLGDDNLEPSRGFLKA